MVESSLQGFFLDPYSNPVPKSLKTGKESNKTENNRDNSFGFEDDLSMLGQGPIKKTPLRKEKTQEPISPETEKEIREIFGEEKNI